MMSFSSFAMRRRLRIANQMMKRIRTSPTNPEIPKVTPAATLLSRNELLAPPTWLGVEDCCPALDTVWLTNVVDVVGLSVTVLVTSGACVVTKMPPAVVDVVVGVELVVVLVLVLVLVVVVSVGFASPAWVVVVDVPVVVADDLVVSVAAVVVVFDVTGVDEVVAVDLVGRRVGRGIVIPPPLVSSSNCLRIRRPMKAFTRSIEDEGEMINERGLMSGRWRVSAISTEF